jgi:hypothetical protein
MPIRNPVRSIATFRSIPKIFMLFSIELIENPFYYTKTHYLLKKMWLLLSSYSLPTSTVDAVSDHLFAAFVAAAVVHQLSGIVRDALPDSGGKLFVLLPIISSHPVSFFHEHFPPMTGVAEHHMPWNLAVDILMLTRPNLFVVFYC